jgi:hypothetical protein
MHDDRGCRLPTRMRWSLAMPSRAQSSGWMSAVGRTLALRARRFREGRIEELARRA